MKNQTLSVSEKPTWKPDHNAQIKNCRVFFNTNPIRASGGIANLVKTNIKSSQIPIISYSKVIATRVHLNQVITVCNLYVPDSAIFPYQQNNEYDKLTPYSSDNCWRLQ